MRIAALSSTTGVSVATLKFYVREGLLHAGVATAVNQADYDDSHVRRVRLIRALVDLGRLSIADAARVIAAVDDDDVAIHTAFGVAQDAMVPGVDRDDPLHADALAEVDRLIARHRMRVRPDAEVRHMLAGALVTMSRFDVFGLGACGPGSAAPGHDAHASMADTILVDGSVLDDVVVAAMAEADAEIAYVPADAERSAQMTVSVVGTIVFEVAAAAIRRLALEHASAGRFGPAPAPRRRRTAG